MAMAQNHARRLTYYPWCPDTHGPRHPEERDVIPRCKKAFDVKEL